MQFTTTGFGLLAILLPTALAQSSPAVQVTNNKPGASYIATLPNNATLPQGSVVVSSAPDGHGVSVQASISDIPSDGGPWLYHIHVNPLDQWGNCSTAGAHLDPTNITEAVTCDPNRPEHCQVGDLSGKHGSMPNGNTSFSANYIDHFVSTTPDNSAFVGNRSLVIHYANKTRITCANFTLPNGASSGGSSNGGSGPVVVTSTASVAVIGSTSTVIAETGSGSGPGAGSNGNGGSGSGVAVTSTAVVSVAGSTATIVPGSGSGSGQGQASAGGNAGSGQGSGVAPSGNGGSGQGPTVPSPAYGSPQGGAGSPSSPANGQGQSASSGGQASTVV